LVLVVVGCAGADRPAPQARTQPPPDAFVLGAPSELPPTDAAIDAPLPDAAPRASRSLPEDPEEWRARISLDGDPAVRDAMAAIPYTEQPCNWHGFEKCNITLKSSPRGTGPGTLRGTVMSSTTAGMIGHSGSRNALSGCKVIATNEAGRKLTARVKRGKFSIDMPAGRYQIVFDDCFRCVVRNHKKLDWVRVTSEAPATASVECHSLGK
jgi:hypothetical protein